MAAELRFRAMGSDAHVIVHGDPLLADLAREEIARLEATWSRFRPDSEVSTLNDRAGEWVEVSPDTQLLVERSILAATVTDGRFDPTVLGDVVRAGYDRDFALVSSGTGEPSSTQRHLHRGVDAIEVDAARGAVRLAEGTGFDPGGIGKGLAADLVVADLLARGARGAMVSVGGDLRVAGTPPNGEAWIIDVEDPRTDLPLARLELLDGGVATSTTLRRRWRTGQRPHHHLLAPTTGASTTSDVVGVTVVADTAAWADALSKVPFVDPTGTACFDHAGALVVHADGDVRTIGHVPGHVHGAVHTTSS